MLSSGWGARVGFMRSVPKAVLLLAALALPIAAVLVSFALIDGPRTPDVPASVQIGKSAGPEPTQPTQVPNTALPPTELPPTELPPPAPNNDDDNDDDLDD
jgi:hypothetical protein